MVSMVDWSSAILRYSNHVQGGIQILYPVPGWVQLSLKNESPVLCPSLVARVQWSDLPFIARFRFQKIIGDSSIAVKSKQYMSFLVFFLFLQQ